MKDHTNLFYLLTWSFIHTTVLTFEDMIWDTGYGNFVFGFFVALTIIGAIFNWKPTFSEKWYSDVKKYGETLVHIIYLLSASFVFEVVGILTLSINWLVFSTPPSIGRIVFLVWGIIGLVIAGLSVLNQKANS